MLFIPTLAVKAEFIAKFGKLKNAGNSKKCWQCKAIFINAGHCIQLLSILIMEIYAVKAQKSSSQTLKNTGAKLISRANASG